MKRLIRKLAWKIIKWTAEEKKVYSYRISNVLWESYRLPDTWPKTSRVK